MKMIFMTRTGALSAIFVLILLYCGIDPFQQSSISGFPEFKAHKVKFSSRSLLPVERDVDNLLRKSEIRFRNELQGPQSIAYDLLGRGPYTDVADGRILFFNGSSWSTFAYASPNRSEICDPGPSSLSYLKNEHICGRPRFNKKTGDLYIADAYFGILRVGPQCGLATPLTTEAEGVPFRFTSDLEIDEYGNVSFTYSSTIYQRRLCKYWLKGEQAGTSEVLAILHGFPENVRTKENGDLWVAIRCRRSIYTHLSGLHPKIRKFILKLPIPANILYLLHIGGWPHGILVKYSPDGKVLKILEYKWGKFVKSVSEVAEIDGKLWIGSTLMPSIAVYSLV